MWYIFKACFLEDFAITELFVEKKARTRIKQKLWMISLNLSSDHQRYVVVVTVFGCFGGHKGYEK